MPKKLVVEITEPEEIELFICLLSLGVTTAIQTKQINLRLGELIIFSPYVMEYLKRLNVRQDVIDIIHHGTEIRDIESIVPESSEGNFRTMISLMNKIIREVSDHREVPSERWIQPVE